MYVLRVEIEIDQAVDDVAARQKAVALVGELFEGTLEELPKGVTVKLQKRSRDQPPRAIRLS